MTLQQNFMLWMAILFILIGFWIFIGYFFYKAIPEPHAAVHIHHVGWHEYAEFINKNRGF